MTAGHGTATQGTIGILEAKQVLKSLPSENDPTYGFFCGATNDYTSQDSKLRVIVARWESSKNESGILLAGTAVTSKPQAKVQSGGTWVEQQKCKSNDVAHNQKERRWCIKPKVSQITMLVICEAIEAPTSPE